MWQGKRTRDNDGAWLTFNVGLYLYVIHVQAGTDATRANQPTLLHASNREGLSLRYQAHMRRSGPIQKKRKRRCTTDTAGGTKITLAEVDGHGISIDLGLLTAPFLTDCVRIELRVWRSSLSGLNEICIVHSGGEGRLG